MSKRTNNPWTQEEIDIILKMREEQQMYEEIAVALKAKGYNRSSEGVRKYYRRNLVDLTPEEKPDIKEDLEALSTLAGEYVAKELKFKIKKKKKPKKDPEKFILAIEDIRAIRDQLVDITTERFIKVGRPVKATKKVLTISDMHCPFENPDVIKHALKNHSDADVLVLNGDIIEHYVVSAWPKEKSILLKWEYKIALEWLKLFASIFPKVVLTEGNHEHRLCRYFSANVDPAVSFLVSPDMLTHLSQGHDFDKMTGSLVPTHDFSNVFYDPGPLSFYTVVGKTIFAHPWSFSSKRATTALRAMDYFSDREDFECVVIAHTHKMSSLIHRHKLVIEQGCTCVPMDYESGGRMTMLPQSFGYAVIYMDEEGHVDFDKSGPVYYGTGSPVKMEDALELLK